MKSTSLILFLLLTQILTAQTFTEMTGTTIDGVLYSSIAFADVNRDGRDDVLITGKNSSGESIAKLYTNDGTGTFTEIPNTSFDGVRWGSIAFSDVNDDGHNDVLITGQNSSFQRTAKLYINNGDASSTEDLNIGISLGFLLFPNPTSPATPFLSYDSAEMDEVTIKVFHANGALLSQQKEYAVKGQQTFAIDIAGLPSGNYFLELNDGKRKGVTRFIVQ